MIPSSQAGELPTKPSPTDKPVSKSDAGVSFWLREFGPVDVNELARDDSHPLLAKPAEPRQRELDELQRLIDMGTGLDEWLDESPTRKW